MVNFAENVATSCMSSSSAQDKISLTPCCINSGWKEMSTEMSCCIGKRYPKPYLCRIPCQIRHLEHSYSQASGMELHLNRYEMTRSFRPQMPCSRADQSTSAHSAWGSPKSILDQPPQLDKKQRASPDVEKASCMTDTSHVSHRMPASLRVTVPCRPFLFYFVKVGKYTI
jgi:hypothetical protein